MKNTYPSSLFLVCITLNLGGFNLWSVFTAVRHISDNEMDQSDQLQLTYGSWVIPPRSSVPSPQTRRKRSDTRWRTGTILWFRRGSRSEEISYKSIDAPFVFGGIRNVTNTKGKVTTSWGEVSETIKGCLGGGSHWCWASFAYLL